MPWDAVIVPDDDERLIETWRNAAEIAHLAGVDDETKRELVETVLRAVWPDLVVINDEGRWTVYRDGAAAA